MLEQGPHAGSHFQMRQFHCGGWSVKIFETIVHDVSYTQPFLTWDLHYLSAGQFYFQSSKGNLQSQPFSKIF